MTPELTFAHRHVTLPVHQPKCLVLEIRMIKEHLGQALIDKTSRMRLQKPATRRDKTISGTAPTSKQAPLLQPKPHLEGGRCGPVKHFPKKAFR